MSAVALQIVKKDVLAATTAQPPIASHFKGLTDRRMKRTKFHVLTYMVAVRQDEAGLVLNVSPVAKRYPYA